MNGKGKGKPEATSKIPSKKGTKPKKAKPSNTATLKAAMMKMSGGMKKGNE